MSANISRRDFVKGITAGAATLAGAGLFTALGKTEAAAAAPAGKYTPGTYTAKSTGMGEITLTATFDENSIVSIELDLVNETPDIGQKAKDQLIEQIMSGQSAEIDGVSGASITTAAVQNALNDVISQASGVEYVAVDVPAETINTGDAVWPVCEPVENYTPVAAGDGVIAYESDPIDESKIIETVDVDALVCGLGMSGFAAAISCGQHGLKTVVLEKNDTATLNSMTVGGLHDRVHAMYGVKFDEKQWLGEAMTKNGYRANQNLYKMLLASDEEAINWWFDQMPFKTEDYKLTFFGFSGEEFDFREPYDVTARDHSWNTSINIPFESTTVMRDYLCEQVVKAGAEIRYETPVVQLIADENGNVIGAYGKNKDGYIKFNVKKGVILATGGYEHNLAKLKECCRPRDLQLCAWLTTARNCTGDGHEMAKAIGAIEDEYPHALMLDPMQLMPYVRVNSEGKRFLGEYETYDHLASAMQSQYGGYDYFITDANVNEAVDNMWSPSSSCYGPKFVWAEAATQGLVADTLEELAEKMGVPVDNFVATINKWNEMCDAGEDTEFGYPGDKMHRIDTAPFYATREMAESLATSGGLQVNEYSQVLNAKNQPIQGLYSIGNASGSMFYGTYPHSMNCLSHTRCVVFGYNVGKNLAK